MSNTVVDRQSSRVRSLFRGLATAFGRWALGEPATIVPRRTADRLQYLEQREQIWNAGQNGDGAFLEREIARLQPTAESLRRTAAKCTPLEDWPDEDIEAMFGPEIANAVAATPPAPSSQAQVGQQ